MDPTQDPNAAPSDAEDTADQSQDPQYVIEIAVNSDGSCDVSCETGDVEESEESGQGGMESEQQPTTQHAKGIKDALVLALKIAQADGQMPDDGSAEDASLQAGYMDR